ncbi:58_t:CDS:1 [Funneliformis caledonium]|uniref:58_t:CDS:1 n=1 Tax=Funneliformis caledonium TaxID=1117310 RepID=A0A9N9DI48_9GLOM|nr:58_t:CDS:1 [Funneliformis caledonium]
MLLIIIGIVSTLQMIIGFCYDVKDVTSSPTTIKDSKEKSEDKQPTYWQQRRIAFQDMIDNLYINYMEKLVNIQQEQAKYWPTMDNYYIYPQSRYNYDDYEGEGQEIMEDNGETSSDGSGLEPGDAGNSNHLYTPPIKITEDTSMSY